MKKFKKVYIEITNRCNLACSFCQPSSRPAAFMQPAAFEDILRKISGSTEHISLHVLGEPLLHPELGRLLFVSHGHRLQVNLTTNGTLLSRNRSVLLGNPALRQVNISLHSFESGGEAALDSYLAGIFDFINAAVAVSPVFINLRLWHPGRAFVPGDRAADSLMRKRLAHHFRTLSPIPDDFPAGRSIILAPQVFLSREEGFIWPHGPAPDLGPHGYCRGLRDHIAILVDGTVVPCCLDAEADMPLGNIFRAALSEILAGPRAAALRDGFFRQRLVEAVCRRCTYRRRFRRNIIGRPGAAMTRGKPTGKRNAA